MPLPEVSRALQALVKAFEDKDKPAAGPVPAAAAAAAAAAAPQGAAALLLKVPEELLLDVLALLNANQLGRTSRVCRDLHRLADDGFLWRELCKREFPFCRPQNYGNDWKKCYAATRKLARGWNEGKPTDFKMVALRGHTNYVTAFSFYRNNVVSGSADNTLRVWNVAREDPLHTLEGHAGAISAVYFNELRIVSASADATVRVWDTATGAPTATLHHDRSVECVLFEEARIASGGADNRVKLWDVRTNQSTRVYTHNAPVLQIAAAGNNLLSRATDATCLWSPANGNTIARLSPSSAFAVLPNSLVLAVGNSLVCCNLNGVHQFSVPLASSVNALSADGNRVVAALANNQLQVVDLQQRRVVHTLADHSGPVQAVQFDGRKIVSGADDNSLKVWDPATGRRLYSLLGGTLQRRANNPAHPTRPGCSGLQFDDGRIVASFQSLLRSYSFDV
jgi:WD40 repeat protein